jgi:hypothetical protein
MSKLSDTVVIHGADGRKIGKIRCYQSFRNYIDSTEIKPGDKPFVWMTVSHKTPVWKNPEAVILWAWKQRISSQNDLENNSLPSICIVCGDKSIFIVGHKITKKATGICCKNKECPMYNVVIPARMIEANFSDIPPDKLLKIITR